MWRIELCTGRRTTIPTESTPSPITSNRRNNTIRTHLPDPMIPGISDKQIPLAINHDCSWQIESRTGRRNAISVVTSYSTASYCRDYTIRTHLPDPLIVEISNEQVALPINCYSVWPIELCIGRWTTIPAVTRHTIACHCRDDAIWTYLSDSMVIVFHNKQVTIPTVTKHTITCYCHDDAICTHLQNSRRISYEQIPAPINRYSGWTRKSSCHRSNDIIHAFSAPTTPVTEIEHLPQNIIRMLHI